ncbi:MAG: undecaprenyl-diphosphate phosphatase [Myxococcota bacterium]
MTDLLQAILLGIVQGLTEFLPVSSSGHLVLIQSLFGADFAFKDDAVLFDLMLHLGTLLPVLLFYRSEIESLGRAAFHRDDSPAAPQRRYWLLMVLVATVPTGLIGILFKDRFEALFHDPRAVFGAMLFTACLLTSTRFVELKGRGRSIEWGVALALGVAQGLAITPGISRSGTTIATALLLRVGRAEAARFSFIMSIPAILGAMVIAAKDGIRFAPDQTLALAAGFATSALIGYLALSWLVQLIRYGRFWWFSLYLFPLSVLGLLLSD